QIAPTRFAKPRLNSSGSAALAASRTVTSMMRPARPSRYFGEAPTNQLSRSASPTTSLMSLSNNTRKFARLQASLRRGWRAPRRGAAKTRQQRQHRRVQQHLHPNRSARERESVLARASDAQASAVYLRLVDMARNWESLGVASQRQRLACPASSPWT